MAELLLPLFEWLVALVAAAICTLAYAFAAPILNIAKTGWNLFDSGIKWLTNKAIDLGIEFTKWMAPYFIDQVDRVVKYFHALGQFAHYAAHFAYRNSLKLSKFAHWTVHYWIPRELRGLGGHTTEVTLTKVRTQPFTKRQLRTLEQTIETQTLRAMEAAIPGVVAKPFPRITWTPKRWREWLGLGVGAGALTLPGTLARERALAGQQVRDRKKTNSRLNRLEKLLGATGAAALVTAGLAKLGLGWMPKCKNLKNIGKSFCGANLSSLIGLFEGLALIVGEWSLLDFAKELQPLIAEGATEVRHFWQADVAGPAKDRQLGQAS